MKIEYFNDGLIGIPFKNGYRIEIRVDDPNPIFNNTIINYLSDAFGEGIIDNENTYFKIISSNSWVYVDRNIKIMLCLKSLDMVNKFLIDFGLECDIDENTLNNKVTLKNKLERFLFEPITQKNKNRIRGIVRKVLYIKPYSFDVILNSKGIKVISKESNEVLFNMHN